jgi:hypothetical protein
MSTFFPEWRELGANAIYIRHESAARSREGATDGEEMATPRQNRGEMAGSRWRGF